ALEVNGVPLFSTVQATFNLLERSAGEALAEAHAAGRTVIVKEALANGRLAQPDGQLPELAEAATAYGASVDVLALAAVLQLPWVDLVLSGAVTPTDVISNLHAASITVDEDLLERLSALTEPAAAYWQHRSSLPWT